MTTEYCWSYAEDELFHGSAESREQAAANALDAYPDDDVVFTGEVIRPNLAELVRVDRFLEVLDDAAYEWLGEWDDRIERWPDLEPEQKADLKAGLVDLLEGFLTKHNAMPTFFRVKNVKEHYRPRYDRSGE